MSLPHVGEGVVSRTEGLPVGRQVKGGLELIQGKQILLGNFLTEGIMINSLRKFRIFQECSLGTMAKGYSSLKRQAVKLSLIVREYLVEKTECHFPEMKMDARSFYFSPLLRRGGIPSRLKGDEEDVRFLIKLNMRNRDGRIEGLKMRNAFSLFSCHRG